MQESNILSNYFRQFTILPDGGQIKTKHVGVSGSYNIVVILIYLCAFFRLNYNNWTVMNGM